MILTGWAVFLIKLSSRYQNIVKRTSKEHLNNIYTVWCISVRLCLYNSPTIYTVWCISVRLCLYNSPTVRQWQYSVFEVIPDISCWYSYIPLYGGCELCPGGMISLSLWSWDGFWWITYKAWGILPCRYAREIVMRHWTDMDAVLLTVWYICTEQKSIIFFMISSARHSCVARPYSVIYMPLRNFIDHIESKLTDRQKLTVARVPSLCGTKIGTLLITVQWFLLYNTGPYERPPAFMMIPLQNITIVHVEI